VRIILRADSGFARDALMNWCETNGVDYLFGLARNTRLAAHIAGQGNRFWANGLKCLAEVFARRRRPSPHA
jgi:hypothetical protein